MLIPRLVFGCGHLTGGASSSESIMLLRRARAAGILHFDTAPSYGLGTAEGLVGSVLAADPLVVVTAKIGFERPSHPFLKTIARRTLRSVRGGPRAPSFYAPSAPGQDLPEAGCFDPAFMARSLEITRERLRRGTVDYLLLHESYASPPLPGTVAFLDEAIAQGHARQVGYANGALYDPALRAAVPPSWIAQSAIDPAMLLGPVDLPAAPTILHTLIKTDAWLRATDLRYKAAAAVTIDAFRAVAAAEAIAVLLPYCLAAGNLPGVKLIYTSSVPARLASILGAAEAIDAAQASGDIAATFRAAYASA